MPDTIAVSTSPPGAAAPLPSFKSTLDQHGLAVSRQRLTTLQVNMGKLCNQACHHCHVEAGPKRTEIMARHTVDRLLALLADAPGIGLVDLTGGAPEMNPHFRTFVDGIRALGKSVIDRCNLTVLFEPGQQDTAVFLADRQVQVVASLPCYSRANVDKQRGKGVFGKSVQALQTLNGLGYGMPDSGLQLDLVYNPVAAHLPPAQAALEADYRQRLAADLGIQFNKLLTITNMPIKRYAHMLEQTGQTAAYMQLLLDNFNPDAAASVMCRELVSVGWDGQLYDCDFNQMLELPMAAGPQHIDDLTGLDQVAGAIRLADHCYGCTAGAGSSCAGALT